MLLNNLQRIRENFPFKYCNMHVAKDFNFFFCLLISTLGNPIVIGYLLIFAEIVICYLMTWAKFLQMHVYFFYTPGNINKLSF